MLSPFIFTTLPNKWDIGDTHRLCTVEKRKQKMVPLTEIFNNYCGLAR